MINKISEEATNLSFYRAFETSKSFFDNNTAQKAVLDNIINEAICLALLPYICDGKFYNLSYKNLKEQCLDDENNFFIHYLKKKIKKFPKDIDLICISNLPSYSQYPTLTLARLLKERFPDSKIVMGGDWISRVSDNIMGIPDFFNVFCDYILPFDGEVSIVELAKYIDKQLDINSVSNLIYLNKNNTVLKNKELSQININTLEKPDYDDYDFYKYFSKPGISMSFSKGCYWGKCKFCSFPNGKGFQIKSIDNAIDELKFYIKKYAVKEFYFVDDCISPKYYNDLAQAIINNGLEIYFSSFAIMDKNFTPELFAKLKKAGLWRLNWGFETNSKNLFEISNKSGCFDKRSDILQASHRAGIINKINIIDELPQEKFLDVIDTVKFLQENLEFIDVFAVHKFRLTKNTEFSLNPNLYDIKIDNIEDFSLDYNYHKTIDEPFSHVHLREFYEQLINESLKYRHPADGQFILKILVESYLKKYKSSNE